jgi:hypothetical protein
MRARAPALVQPTGRCHILKTLPQFFAAIAVGRKTFELRRDDRPGGYQVGDVLTLVEWGDDLDTGKRLDVLVLYVMRGPGYGLADGWACLAIAELEAGRRLSVPE